MGDVEWLLERTDSHSCYVISMIIDPRLKLEGFKNLGWSATSIVTAKNHNEYEQKDATVTQTIPVQAVNHPLDLIFRSVETGISPIPRRANSKAKQYINELVEGREVDTAQWWRLHAHQYPTLSRIVRDYLLIPATSVPSERLFSRAGDIITKKRNRLLEFIGPIVLVRSGLNFPECEKWEQEDEKRMETSYEVEDGVYRDLL